MPVNPGYIGDWRFSRPCSVVKTQSSNKNRSFAWEDEAPEEPLLRRARKGVPPAGRALPDIPLEMEDPESGGLPLKRELRFGRGRFDEPKRPWWRPASKLGRAFLTLAALVMLGGLAACASLLITFLNSDARFRISGANNIEATGLTEVSRAQMLPVFGEDIGRNIFFVPLGERRRQLEEIPWVETATVMRLLPNQIRVSIVERQPVAFVRQGAEIGLVDANGILLTMPAAMMAQRHYSFPVVTGINTQDPLTQRKARMEVYQRLLAELDASGQKLSEQISDIDLSDPADARVLMPEANGEILAHFGQEHFLERYQRYKAHISGWQQQYPKLAAVDLRYDQQVVLGMATGADVAQAAADAQNVTKEKQPDLQAAENGQTAGDSAEKHPSGAKARVDSAGIMRGLKPPPPSGSSLSAVSKAPADSGSSDARAKALAYQSRPSAKAKATATKNTQAKANTAQPTAKSRNNKRAEIQRAAQNVNRRKSAPTTLPASSAGQGQ
jgi:cell division protein FtsQ